MFQFLKVSFKLNAFIKSENVDPTDDIFHQWQSFLFKHNLEQGYESFYHSSDTQHDFLGIIQRVVINVENVKTLLVFFNSSVKNQHLPTTSKKVPAP